MIQQDFDYIRNFLRETSALVLDDGKQYLVETRLISVIREFQLESLSDLVLRLRGPNATDLRNRVVEAMMTTETSFFRDLHPFESLRKQVLPELISKRQKEQRLNIWCAASSTGQEPYSFAILIREHFPELANWKINLLATDLSREVLARAREGKYSQIEINRGMPAALLLKHFQQHGTSWQLHQDIRGMVDFREVNLARPWPLLPRMDLVFLRNVMIYFDIETKKSILNRMVDLIRPDGYLLLGGAETTFNLCEAFARVESIKGGFYQLVG